MPSPAPPSAWLLEPLRLNVPQLERCTGEVQEQLSAVGRLLNPPSAPKEEIVFPGGPREFVSSQPPTES
jgi:hypothetical protein